MDQALGREYSKSWASMHVMAELGGQTAQDALDAGVSPKVVWRAVWATLQLPVRDR